MHSGFFPSPLFFKKLVAPSLKDFINHEYIATYSVKNTALQEKIKPFMGNREAGLVRWESQNPESWWEPDHSSRSPPSSTSRSTLSSSFGDLGYRAYRERTETSWIHWNIGTKTSDSACQRSLAVHHSYCGVGLGGGWGIFKSNIQMISMLPIHSFSLWEPIHQQA